MSLKKEIDLENIIFYTQKIESFFEKKGIPVPTEIKLELEKICALCKKNIELSKKNNEIIDVGKSIVNVQEAEQKRISRELHDGPAQSIANILFYIQMYEKEKKNNPRKADSHFNKIKQLGEECLTFLRHFIRELRPMSLDDLGLIPALKRYIDRFSNENNIFIEFEYDEPDLNLTNEKKTNLFRVFQEALNNVKKHSEADKIFIKIKVLNKSLEFTIEDNGKGFSTSQKKEGHFGIVGMKERIELLGGRLSIESDSQKGCCINGKLPIG